MDYNANDQDRIRGAYLQKRPCQPRDHNFLQKSFGQKLRQFNQTWFSEFANWLEYSVVNDAAFCLYCYLFKPDIGDQASGDSFVDVKVVTLSNAPQNLKLTSSDIQKTLLGLSISRLRGQGYDGATNMQASCKRRDIVREKQASNVAEALNTGELSSGQGLNQETNLKRAGDTHWGSHYGTLVSLASMFSTVIDVLEMISKDGSNLEQRAEANVLLGSIQSFEFVFNLHLRKMILAITSELSQALQRKDQDIVNAMNLVQISKVRLQKMRESGWTSSLDDILSFCEKHEIDVPQMEDMFVARGRKRRNAQEITNLHHYRAELFHTVLDMQVQELNARFTVSNTDLLLCVACLNPSNSFSSFDKKKLIHLAEFYPKEFSSVELMVLND
ncbi:uncharacterized protein LOC114315457 [Camellia sinensis]|uniref:uncharacterized protein LOC114315457 n=1 Tax=Camellia sinensis TaxID=4442 RepID=UPI001035EF00|nr:uncharacterized protein LOC114315457 [Camellia sinensis]